MTIYDEIERVVRQAALRIDPDCDTSKIRIRMPRRGDKFDVSTNAAFVLAEGLHFGKK